MIEIESKHCKSVAMLNIILYRFIITYMIEFGSQISTNTGITNLTISTYANQV